MKCDGKINVIVVAAVVVVIDVVEHIFTMYTEGCQLFSFSHRHALSLSGRGSLYFTKSTESYSQRQLIAAMTKMPTTWENVIKIIQIKCS